MAHSKSDPDGVRINFRLNPQRPKERIILEFLRRHAENYDASRIIKQMLYEVATGRSWLTDQPIQTVVYNEVSLPPAQNEKNDEVLDDIMAGLDDWAGG